VINFIIEIIYTFFASLFPNWSDDFEQNNPIQSRKNSNANTNSPTDNQQANNNIIADENIQNEPTLVNENLIDNPKSSENNTKLAINDVNSNKFKLTDQHENKTENEYEFSENINIDTLSYNEPAFESLKRLSEIKETENTKHNSNNKDNGQ
jgi:hypothetical protein